MTAPIDYAAVLADLRARRRQLDAAIASIETILGATASPADAPSEGGTEFTEDDGPPMNLPMPPRAPRPMGTTLQNDTFFGLSTPEAIRKYLSIMKRPQKLPVISKALLDGGQIHAVDPTTTYNNVYASIKRMEKAGDAVKIKTGEWGLAEWYSNKSRGDAE